MVDNIIDIEGFERYGPAPGQWHSFFPNFLIAGSNLTPLMSQSWFEDSGSNVAWDFNSPQLGLIAGLGNKGGVALAIANAFGDPLYVRRNLPGPYSRLIMGFAIMTNLAQRSGIWLSDNNGNAVINKGNPGQCFIGIDTIGRVVFMRGTTVLFASASLICPSTRHYIEIDCTINDTTGAYKIWLNGVLLTSATNQNTRGATSNNYINSVVFVNGDGYVAFDDMYWRDNTNGTATPYGDCTIQGLPPISDNSVQFTSNTILGKWYAQQTLTTAAPGANQLALVPVTPEVNMTINSVGILPKATSSTVKFKGVIYSDNAGSPGSLLSSGTEVVACTSGTNLSMPLVTPQALTGSAQYWIGFITDTSIVLQLSDTYSALGQNKSNTYTSGAPAGPLSGMTTGQSPWSIWGVCTSAAANYVGVAKVQPPPQSANTSLTGNFSSTALQEDLFETPDINTAVSIATVKLSVQAVKTTTGSRSMDIRLKSGATTSGGNRTGIVPPPAPLWYSTRYDTDPNTSSAWTTSGINNMKIGYKVAT